VLDNTKQKKQNRRFGVPLIFKRYFFKWVKNMLRHFMFKHLNLNLKKNHIIYLFVPPVCRIAPSTVLWVFVWPLSLMFILEASSNILTQFDVIAFLSTRKAKLQKLIVYLLNIDRVQHHLITIWRHRFLVN
jgi:hypothetical protein